MLSLFIGIAIGAACVFFYFRGAEKTESKYARMSGAALRDRYRECQEEYVFWTKILTADIESIGIMKKNGAGYDWFANVGVIVKVKKIAVWRIDALDDIMEEIRAQEYGMAAEPPWNELSNIHPKSHPAT